MKFKFVSCILKQGSLREFDMGCNKLFKDPKILEFKAPCQHRPKEEELCHGSMGTWGV